ncbi:serine hydrolase FSH [Astrocystis sublimbata]|nr:serine hydrolase FSH [Astrocystis sublimbata]
MHTLMLHGHATSAFIFKAQTGQFRSKLDKSFTFDFVDAPIPSELPASLKRVFKTAFTWIDEKRDVESVRDTAHWLLQYMEQNGPYDCVCCFSQSAAIVTTLVLDNNLRPPEERISLPFKSIVFMNANLEYTLLEAHGLPVGNEARGHKRAAENILHARTNDLQNLANVMTLMSKGTAGMWKDTSALLHDASSLPPKNDCFGLDFTAFPREAFITGLQTVHIYGAMDPIWLSSVQMAYLCHANEKNMYDHQGGHDVPRSPKVAANIASLFRKLAKSLSVKP